MKKSSIFSVFFVYFLDYFGIAVIFPLSTPLFLEGNIFAFNDTSFQHRLFLLALLIASFPLAQFFGVPFFGDLSDKKGRKYAFYFTLLGEMCGYFLTGLALHFQHLPFLFFSRLFTGFFAGNLTVCLSSIADLSKDPFKRSKYFGYLAMSGGLSFIFAVLVGGIFSDNALFKGFTPSFPFWILTGITFLNLLIIKILYQETKKTDKEPRLHSWGFRKESFYIFQNPMFKAFYATFFFFMLGWMPALQFLPSYMIENFSASKLTITYTLLSSGIIWMFTNGCINPLLTKAFKPLSILSVSLFFLSIFFFISSRFHTMLLFTLFFLWASVGASLSWTNCLAAVSLSTIKENQGYVLGWNQAIGSLAMIVGPFMGALTGLFGTRAIFSIISFCIFIAFLIIFIKQNPFRINRLKT